MERTGRRAYVSPVAMEPRAAATIERRHLDEGVAAQRVRWLGRDVIQVAATIPDGRVGRVVQHLLTGHGGPSMADAFGVVSCDEACPSSAAWFATVVDSASIG